MFDLILYQPEIPPNTGNIIRLCANTGVGLHLVEPLGFSIDDKQLQRAGLDYHEFARIQVFSTWAECAQAFSKRRVFAMTTKGQQNYAEIAYQPGDAFILGPETRGLPTPILEVFPASQRIRIPMLAHSRSLNLANAAAIIVYEAWRQAGFQGGS